MPIIKKPSNFFKVILDTGANIKASCESAFGDGLYIIKDIVNANNWQWVDFVRGTSSVLQSNTAGVETTYVVPTGNSVGYCFKGNGPAVTNNDGTISSQVSANTISGFSIVTYTGTGVNATVGHGLTRAPSLVIVKVFGAAAGWFVWHNGILNTQYLQLNSALAATSSTSVWNSTSPSASIFNIGTATGVNNVSGTYVAYCFAEVPGFSKIGVYTGNAAADGPFVWCGFRPKLIIIKNTTSTESWYVFDTSRDTYNVSQSALNFERNVPAATLANAVDILSNGFKLRSSSINAGTTYIFMAFAETPFNYSNAC